MDKFAERRLVENELIFRSANEKVQKQVFKDQLARRESDALRLHFYCECSSFRCRDRIIITAEEYHAAHTGNKIFITLPGHENAAVEKVIEETATFTVVEKYLDPAKVVKPL